MFIPGGLSKNTVKWAAEHQYPYIMLATDLHLTKPSFEYYHECAAEAGFKSGPEHLGYLFKVHVDETEELAEAAGRKYVQGPSNPFLAGNEGIVRPFIQNLPGMTSRTNVLPTIANYATAAARGRVEGPPPASASGHKYGSYEYQTETMSIISGTPKTVIPKVKHVLEYLRPGTIFFWDGDGAMTHEDSMRSLRLMGEEVLPAVREMGKELGLTGPFDGDKPVGISPAAWAAVEKSEGVSE
jgi:alkanesulfonate monooxygenase SsuD/methylene tetrahydromethanopterin reductase-like flavin-dependent oxidoreductase (luciferase family)